MADEDESTIPPLPSPSSRSPPEVTMANSSTRQQRSSASSIASSASSSSSASEAEEDGPARPSSSPSSSRRARIERPGVGGRVKSSSIIVPKDTDVIQRNRPEYPPSDARSMSPRRNSQDIERLSREVRRSLMDQARTLQSSLAALAEKIDEVKSDHDKLENENKFLQQYIGGLTRGLAKGDLGSSKARK